MVFEEPKVEFVKIDMNSDIVTVSNTQGGETCIGVEPNCGDVATSEICSATTQTGPSYQPGCDDESMTGPGWD